MEFSASEFLKDEVEENEHFQEIDENKTSIENFWFKNNEIEEKLSIDEAQKYVEEVYERSLQQIVEMNDTYLPMESKERIYDGIDSIEAVKYDPSNVTIGSFTYHNGLCCIEICNINKEQMERTIQHETNHFVSYNKELQNPVEEGIKFHKISGIHKSEFLTDEKGRIIEFKDEHRGFNEGITQMYTNRQLEMLEKKKGENALRQNGYQMATELSVQLERIVGEEMVAKAYYGGNMSGLENRINELAGVGAFERLSKDMDKVTYSRDFVARIEAMRDAQELLADISEGVKK